MDITERLKLHSLHLREGACYSLNMALMQEAAVEIDRLRAEVVELQALSVTNILIDVVPGEDGMGLEVYAKSVADVECEFSSMVDRIESLEQQLDAALAKVNP